ncbi:winged helix-turn-helix transcriptional regulator [Pararhodobacter sp.]|uniref:winged helix-turn-helix transcriptional regulator n=1 Tax=Pararhodobacter sp. TaxID=2127056 RepID=UPI002FE11B93
MKWDELKDESCPVARGLSVIGDRWTLMVLRDCFLGVRRFEAMQARLGITRHVLADRLRKLEADGVLRREAYQERPLRHEYRLTEKGKALYPVLVALIGWAEAHVPAEGPTAITLVSRETGERVEPVLTDARTGRAISHRDVTALRNA